MLIYHNPKYPHTLEVEERETVRIDILTRAGWRLVAPVDGESPQPVDAPKLGRPKGKAVK